MYSRDKVPLNFAVLNAVYNKSVRKLAVQSTSGLIYKFGKSKLKNEENP